MSETPDDTPSNEHVDRLHVGCGNNIMSGWVNVDIRPFEGVDVVCDVRRGLPFSGVGWIFAEHFIEHLQVDDAFRFLRSCRQALRAGGRLRISTPNLDWVMQSHYAYGRWRSHDDAIGDALATNMAFHGWGHRFIYNYSTLALLVAAAGFSSVEPHAYGESNLVEFKGLERHPKSPDWPGLRHVVVVEAFGIGPSLDLPEIFRDYLQVCDGY